MQEDEAHDEAIELPLSLQDTAIPATGVSEFERGWAVNEHTKKADEKRKKEIAAKKAATALVSESNNVIDANQIGKKTKPRKKANKT